MILDLAGNVLPSVYPQRNGCREHERAIGAELSLDRWFRAVFEPPPITPCSAIDFYYLGHWEA